MLLNDCCTARYETESHMRALAAAFIHLRDSLPKFRHLPQIKRCFNSSVKMSSTPYGSWKSPISSKLVSESSVGFQELHVDKHPDHKGGPFFFIHCEYTR